jgi:hypothetical protein
MHGDVLVILLWAVFLATYFVLGLALLEAVPW